MRSILPMRGDEKEILRVGRQPVREKQADQASSAKLRDQEGEDRIEEREKIFSASV